MGEGWNLKTVKVINKVYIDLFLVQKWMKKKLAKAFKAIRKELNRFIILSKKKIQRVKLIK